MFAMQIRILSAILLLSAAACSAPPPAPPAPAPTVAPVALPLPVSQQPSGDWIDWPIADGNWVYRQDDRGSLALFGASNRDATLTLRCDKGRGRIYLARAGTLPSAGGQITVRTSSMMKSFVGAPTGDQPYIATEIMPNDTILDAMVYTRGRFALEVSGQQSIAIPSWSEVARVVQDCRG